MRIASLRARDFKQTVRGVPLNLGLVSSAFTQSQRGDVAFTEKPVVVVVNNVLTNDHLSKLLPLYEDVARASAYLVLAARDFDPEALAMLTINQQRATMSCAPLVGELRDLERLAELSATAVVDIERGLGSRGTLPGLIATIDQCIAIGEFRGSAEITITHVGGRNIEDARARR